MKKLPCPKATAAAAAARTTVSDGFAYAAKLDPKKVADAAVAGARSAASKGLAYAAENPKNVAGGAAVIAGAAVITAPGMLTGPVLKILGFGSFGPKAGTIAAGVQSGIGNVVAKSVFATVQSAQMGGYGAGMVASAAQGVGATLVVAGGVAMGWVKKAWFKAKL
ncbi:hypothetical protein QBC39DRAFT_420555 [Podospora conica]|nr:hypothetical protein QBC39DRAFT_420555 [Schizothecium conicum]